MVFFAFSFHRALQLFKTIAIFYFSNLIVLGFVIFICFLTKTKAIAINNSIIYFNISSINLIASAFVAYVASVIIIRLHNRTLGKEEIYTLVITNNNVEVSLYAFLDTGNRLREPFSNAPVIIVDQGKVIDLIGNSKTRLIPSSTISSNAYLSAFKPDSIILKSTKSCHRLDNVYIALSDNVSNKSYSAILNPDILSI